jgi:N-acyl-D-aspartate/D-glutamate deacylase
MRKSVILCSLIGFAAMLLLSGCAGMSSRPDAKAFDIVIQNGEIFDGSGDESYTADIAVKNGNIVAIGNIYPDADIVINAEGKYVAPGFIDIHTHASFMKQNKEDEESTRSAANYLYQGVTTVVGGNCGSGTIEIGKTIEYINKNGAGPNVVQLIGHGSIRRAVIGSDDRDPSLEELEEMKSILRKAMEDGAFGMSTGLFYAPGCYAEIEEVIELAKVVKEYNGIYATHIRDEGSNNTGGLIASIKEAIKIGEEAGVPVQISHIKCAGKPAWGKAREVTGLIEAARSRGVKVFADQYPYSAASTSLSAIVVPRWVHAGGNMRDKLRDPELIDRIKKEIGERMDRYNGAASLQIAGYRQNTGYEGKNLQEISEMVNKNPVDTAVDILLEGDPSLVIFMMRPEDVEYYMRKPYVMTGSDGSNVTFGSGIPHPRHYGTFPHKIRKYTIEQGILSMPEVIKKATSLPAEMLGLDDRGYIRAGFKADIVIFNPETIGSPATFTDPHNYGNGIDYLIINGKQVIAGGKYNNSYYGEPLKLQKTVLITNDAGYE